MNKSPMEVKMEELVDAFENTAEFDAIIDFPLTSVTNGFRNGFKAALDLPEVKALESTLRRIMEIGKRDMSNIKYDTYFDEAKEALKSWQSFISGGDGNG